MEISLVKYDIDYEYINKQKIHEKYNNNICNWPLVYEVKMISNSCKIHAALRR